MNKLTTFLSAALTIALGIAAIRSTTLGWSTTFAVLFVASGAWLASRIAPAMASRIAGDED
jgi:hypothetical protein